MSDAATCKHVWVANSGRGGEPEFHPGTVGGNTPVMHVTCRLCNTRTWFSESRWMALPRDGESRARRRQRLRDAAVLARREQEREAKWIAQRKLECARTGETWWQGEPAQCRRVRVIVGPSERPTWWCAKLVGTERIAVEVTYAGQTFYLDDEDGSGWAKVTRGRGSPDWGHASVPVERVIGEVEG